MAVNMEVTPINEQLRELVKQRYSTETKTVRGQVDVSGGKRKVNVQVRAGAAIRPGARPAGRNVVHGLLGKVGGLWAQDLC